MLLLIATLVLLASAGKTNSHFDRWIFVRSVGTAGLGESRWRMALRGRVIFPNGPRTPVESDGVLEVQLQDTSMADAPALIVARYLGKAIEFPMAFALKYDQREVIPGRTYSLRVSVRNKNNELLYTNDVHLGVTPVGEERTTFVDAPVILVKPSVSKIQWPDVIGLTGEEAVRIIKEETGMNSVEDSLLVSTLHCLGFSNVPIVAEGSPITMDYRSNRVRVFVDKDGYVSSMPSVS